MAVTPLSMTCRCACAGDAESRIISPNGAEMAEIIEINVHHVEFDSDDDGRRILYDPIDITDRLQMLYIEP